MANVELRLSTGSTASEVVPHAKSSIGGKMAKSGSSGTAHLLNPGTFSTNSIWDDISQGDNASSAKDYRVLYIYNNPVGSNTGPMLGTKVYVGGQTYAKFKILKGQLNQDATLLPNENDAGSLNGFSEHTRDNPLTLGSLEAGDFIPIYVERTAQNISGAGETRESFELTIVASA